MDLVNLFKQKRQTLISLFLLFLVLGLFLVLLQDFKYGSKSKILVIQGGAERVDPFSVSRSVEYLSDLFTRVVYSNSFFDTVMESDFNIDKNYFGQSFDKKMKTWRQTVSAKSVEDSGIIVINVYHPDSYQANQIALAVNHVLISSHQTYHGLGDSVKINVIDQPIVSSYPIKPNLIYSLLIIIAISLFFGLMYIYLFPERKYDINFFGSKKSDSLSRNNKRRAEASELIAIREVLARKNLEIEERLKNNFDNSNNSNSSNSHSNLNNLNSLNRVEDRKEEGRYDSRENIMKEEVEVKPQDKTIKGDIDNLFFN